MRRICNFCNERPVMKNGKDNDGTQKYKTICNQCRLEKYGNVNSIYRKYVGIVCEKCGVIAENKIQIDGHHIDGNHGNNEADNILSLCANCHRLHHFLE